MKKATKTRKPRLVLARQTVRTLSPKQLDRVAGGDTEEGPSLITCWSNCSC